MDIFDSSGNKIRLTQKHFLAEGGEGKLYANRGNVFKIYLDERKVIPEAKMDELKMLESQSIIRPLDSIYDTMNKRVGFSMRRIDNPIPLARTFTTSFWNNNSVTPEKMVALVKKMQSVISYIHSKGFLIVDGNEFNYMVDASLETPFFIDVDSYQTPSFPATAIMPSIRDYTQAEFNQGTDWFAFAIVAFQMMVGIHPYKGRHADFKKGDFEGRVKARMSVLNPEVSYPSSVRDFALIPKPYMEWFRALFEEGQRLEPPTGEVRVMAAKKKRIIRDGDKVSIAGLYDYGSLVRRYKLVNGQPVVSAGNILYVGKSKYDIPDGAIASVLGANSKPIFIGINTGVMVYRASNASSWSDSGMQAGQVFVADNIAYLRNEGDLVDVRFIDAGGVVRVAPGTARKVMPHATSIFGGVVYENVMGKSYLSVPARPGVMPVMLIKELEGYTIVDGRYERGVAMLSVATKDGEYKQARVRFTKNFDDYDIEVREDIDDPLNFTVLDKGVIVTIVKEGVMEVTSASPGNDSVRLVEDAQIGGFMRLSSDGDRVLFMDGKEIYRMTLK